MINIIPLAGPDFVIEAGLTKAEQDFKGNPMLKSILYNRKWFDINHEFIFVFLDGLEQRRFFSEKAKAWFPKSNAVFITKPSSGAALSALCGCSIVSNKKLPIIFDLADIDYSSNLTSDKIIQIFNNNDAISLNFVSSNPAYSYLKYRDDIFLEAKEKKVISNIASAGTYIYKDFFTYNRALNDVINTNKYKYNNLDYICPIYNGVKSKKIYSEIVTEVQDIKNN